MSSKRNEDLHKLVKNHSYFSFLNVHRGNVNKNGLCKIISSATARKKQENVRGFPHKCDSCPGAYSVNMVLMLHYRIPWGLGWQVGWSPRWAQYLQVQGQECVLVPCLQFVTNGITHHFGFKRRLDLFVCKAIPVDASEEGLLPDVHFSLRTTAKTLWRMLGHQLADRQKVWGIRVGGWDC